MTDESKKEIVEVLKRSGRSKSLAKSKELEMSPIILTHLNFRDVDLTSEEIHSVLESVKNDEEIGYVESISFSINKSFGDKGALAFSKLEFKALKEIEMVDCGISDKGGNAIFKKIQDIPNLKLLALEGNKISDTLKKKFEKWATKNPSCAFTF